jgi:predicted dehydrogenase
MGCGGIARRFCDVLRKEGGVKIQAAAARDTEKAAAFAREYGAEWSGDYEGLVRNPDVDIVYIATVHGFHYEHIRLCLENGKGVLCEKPMVLHEWQARECFELAADKKLFLMEGMWVRCNPCVRKAAQWVSEGLIGDVRLITANFCFNSAYNPESRLYNPVLGGGALYDVGVYVIEFATGIMGQNPVYATGTASRLPGGSTGSGHPEESVFNTGVDTHASLSLGFPGGALASLNCGINVGVPPDAVIYGSKGSITLPHFWSAHDAVCMDGHGNRLDSFHADFEDGFCFEIRHVVDLIMRGKLVSDLVPPEDTIACAGVFDKILYIPDIEN